MWCSLVLPLLVFTQVLTHLIVYRHDPTACTSLVSSAEDWSNSVRHAMLVEAQSEASNSVYVASFGLLDTTRGGGCHIYLYDVKCVLAVLTGVWCMWKYKTSQSVEQVREEVEVDNGPPIYRSKTPTVTPNTTPTSSPTSSPSLPKIDSTQLRKRLTINTQYVNDLGLV